jgi:hypothetical protein
LLSAPGPATLPDMNSSTANRAPVTPTQILPPALSRHGC